MHGTRPSSTAVSAARHRAVHQILEHGAVFRDPLAIRITGESEDQLIAESRANPDRLTMRWFVCARARLAEDLAAEAARSGARQLVILGAGLDTFGYRNPHRDMAVVELDHPATQQDKYQRLVAAGIDPAPVRRVAIDFEHDDLATTLTNAIDASRPTLFWWLGVTPYLTHDAIVTTARTLARLPSVAVVLDHASPTADLTGRTRTLHDRRRARVAELGEPWLSEYLPDDISTLLVRAGFADTWAVHERTVIDRALGRPGSPPGSPSHLIVAARNWPLIRTLASC